MSDPGGRHPDDADGPDEAEPVGSLAEEAARLFAALADWEPTDLGDRVADAVREVDEHLATGGADCRYCPVCRAVDLVRRTDPDVAHHLAEAAQSLSRAVSAMLATAHGPQSRARPQPRAPGVEHIDLTDPGDRVPGEDGVPGEWDDAPGDEPDPEQEEHQ